MTPSHPAPARPRGRIPVAIIAIVGGVLALIGVEFFALYKYGRAPSPTPVVATALAPIAPAPAPAVELPAPEGWLDTPANESIVGTRVALSGWALAKDGIARVEVRVDGRVFQARYGLPREDVATVKPGFPDNPKSGFTFEGDFADLTPMRHDIVVVAIAKNRRETVLARRSLVPTAAMTQWKALLDERPALASRKFFFLMMTSGVSLGGADEIKDQYPDYQSRTQRIGMSVPLLFMRTTKGRAGDWQFDPRFDLERQCKGRRIVEDNLETILAYSIKSNLPVQIILNGGLWGDSSCETPNWDLTDHLEEDKNNCQWDQRDEVHPDNLMKDLTGSVPGPELGNSLTYHVYAAQVRAYKKRNLQAAARRIAEFARKHPDLLVGVTLDADTYMNPFLGGGFRFDYSPGMLRQFREWLQGTGPYAGRGGPGVPDLRSFRRSDPLTLAEVGRLAEKDWKAWSEVQPPRDFVGANRAPVPPGAIPFWENKWYLEWDAFRKHIIHLHYIELADWVHAAGVPAERIFTAQAFTAPDPGLRPVSIHLRGWTPDYDSAGVSIEGSVPRVGHLGTIIYGLSAQDRHPMENGRGLFSNIARFDETWAVIEFNATDLKFPKKKPDFEASYRAFRSVYNYDGRQLAAMAWNGSNGLFENHPDYVPYTAFRNTHSETAMRDAMVARADLPAGSRIWTFGTSQHADDDGWTTSRGTLTAGHSHLAVAPDRGVVELISPNDQVIRPQRYRPGDRPGLGRSRPDPHRRACAPIAERTVAGSRTRRPSRPRAVEVARGLATVDRRADTGPVDLSGWRLECTRRPHRPLSGGKRLRQRQRQPQPLSVRSARTAIETALASGHGDQRSSVLISTYARSRIWRTHSWNCSSDLRWRSARRACSRWRSFVTSCLRRSWTWIRCQPNGVRTGGESSPILSSFIASLEVRHGVARRDPAEVAALRGRRVLGVRRFAWSSNLAPVSMRSRMRSIFAFASTSDVISLTLTRMCRTRVCSTTVGALRLRVSTQLDDVKAAGERSTRRHVARLHLAHRLGEHRRQPRRRAPAEAAALQRVRSRPRSSRRPARSRSPILHLRSASSARGAAAARSGRATPAPARARGCARAGTRSRRPPATSMRREVVVDLGVAHDDLAVDLALAQPLDR